MNLVSISKVLLFPEDNPEGWFYLPPDDSRWNLKTEGVFSLDSVDFHYDSDEFLPVQAKEGGWIETLDNASIEEIIENARIQLGNPSINELFNAFLFYFQDDAFIEF
ncbi:DUF7716 domain-containing protein [Xenorhabdus szentirmaii]|uniref:DUF7716 domain-containing protein n=1 Tax=Xenorhabdus szentirmaii DSM 16338 TaxID=1427518 RepID=W1J6M2_9GAMM|nr:MULTISPECIES: hypothetical protein [Xenorhabdus]MBD2780601.1 hypothetical protein [Xenorhabdus sp. 38]PHM32922.1 hypothetical protein Xsze_03674 [Xenorhabdus szentirmaii DSM 16338]CDL85125.1 conserved hypothetical protein [Xenorhabdus szentirmaii DSM 16338]